MNQVLYRAYMSELELLLDRERQLIDALPKMATLATDEDLKTIINNHLEETRKQAARLTDIIESHTANGSKSETCPIMEVMLSEIEEMVRSVTADANVKDAVIIAGARKVEHFEIASYQTAIEWADVLEFADDRVLLEDTLSEEKNAADDLAGLAQGGLLAHGINEDAAE